VTAAVERFRWVAVAAVLAVWIAGWGLLQGTHTLAIGGAELTDFHRWLLELRDSIELQRESNAVLDVFFGSISSVLDWCVTTAQDVLSRPAIPRPVPEIGWLGVVAIAALLTCWLASVRMAVLTVAVLVTCGLLGYWTETMDTLIVTGVAVGVCVGIGMPTAIWMAGSHRATTLITPVLDVMQTLPAFAYLAPLVLFFSINAASAVVVTLIYALPPLIRISASALRSVEPATVEATRSIGATSWQLLRQVQLPMARRTILVGLNQTTMAALSMATIAALINGPGLGRPVVKALQALDIGGAAVSGLCIVLVAIMLDRVTTAAGERSETARRAQRDPRTRRLLLVGMTVPTLVAVLLSRRSYWAAEFPDDAGLGARLATWLSDVNETVVDVIRPATQAFRDLVSYNLLNPLQSLLAESPWWLMAGVLVVLAFLLGGVRATVPTVVCVAVMLGTGLWNESMKTLAMVLVSAIAVMSVGVALGVLLGRNRRVDLWLRPVLDGLQTIPPFVYLVPALALFGPGRFTAIAAAIAYAVPVAVKLVADGIRGVPASTVEAAESAGTTSGQMIWKVQLPMARSALLLAVNQGLLFVLAMVVIGGLVGGEGLGFLVVNGFAQTTGFGKGLAAGIAITALGVMLDRICFHTAARYDRVATQTSRPSRSSKRRTIAA
jgi:glycine betaine/proline transport system permease protein